MILAVDLPDDPLIHARRRSSEPFVHLESDSLLGAHEGDPRGDGLEVGDGAEVGLDVKRVPVTLLLRVVKRLLVRILAVRRGSLRGPGGEGDPLVVEDRPIERFTTGAGEVDFL